MSLFSDDGQLRDDVDERRKTGRASESIRCGHGVAQTTGLRSHWHDPHPRPHLCRLPRILSRRASADAAPPRGDVNRLSHVVDVDHHGGRVLCFTGPTIDRRHAETDALSPLEAVCQYAVRRKRRWVVEAREVAPDHQLPRWMSLLRRWRRWRRRIAAASPTTLSLAFLRGWLLSGDARRQNHAHEYCPCENRESFETHRH